jgi:hypothetical protein
MAMISRQLIIAVPVLLACAGCINRTPAVKEVPAPVVAANPTPVRMAPVPTANWKAMVAPEPTSSMEIPIDKTKWAKLESSKGSSGEDSDSDSLLSFQTSPEEKQYIQYIGTFYTAFMSLGDIPDNATIADLQDKIREAVQKENAARVVTVPQIFDSVDLDLIDARQALKSAGQFGLSEDEVFGYIKNARDSFNRADSKIKTIRLKWAKTRPRV